MYIENIFVGLATFAVIGIFHPIVIKAEYYFSKKIWPVFFLAGIASLCGALFVEGHLGDFLSVFAFTLFWCIKELYEQEERVKKGYFPAGKHHKKISDQS